LAPLEPGQVGTAGRHSGSGAGRALVVDLTLATATQLRWRIASRYPFTPGSYLDKQALPHTLRRLGAGHYGYEWSQKAKKRDLIQGLESRVEGAGYEVLVVPGRRFDLEAFLRGAFELPSGQRWIEIRARAERLPV
jgi:hypothetical protein